MRKFQRVLHELKDVVARHKPGELLRAPASLPFVDIDGRKMHYIDVGTDQPNEKPAFVLLHGFGGFFMDWPRVMIPLSRHAHVYAVDLPGWGFSDLNTQARSLEDDVAAVRAFIEALGLKRVILCGISYGAGVAWAAAALNLPRVERAVLLNPMPPNPIEFIISPVYQSIFTLNLSRPAAVIGHKMLRKSAYKLICKENLLNDRLLDTFYLDLAYLVTKQPKMPFIFNAHARGAREVDWADWEHKLAGTRVPVSILQGLNDRVFSYSAASHLYELIPHAELIDVPDCGHAMVFDQHRKVSDFLIGCLERADGVKPKSVSAKG